MSDKVMNWLMVIALCVLACSSVFGVIKNYASGYKAGVQYATTLYKGASCR